MEQIQQLPFQNISRSFSPSGSTLVDTKEMPLVEPIYEPSRDLLFGIPEIKHSIQVLNSLKSRKLELKKSLTIVIKETPEDFIAELSDINAWGSGDTELEAQDNLCEYLEDLYFSSKEEQKKLGRAMKKQWEFLKEFIKEKK